MSWFTSIIKNQDLGRVSASQNGLQYLQINAVDIDLESLEITGNEELPK